MTAADRIVAPWTDEEVDNLNAYQAAGVFHPFTCGNGCRENNLLATNNGWICPHCDYTQDWAHAFMLTERARTPFDWGKYLADGTELT